MYKKAEIAQKIKIFQKKQKKLKNDSQNNLTDFLNNNIISRQVERK